MPDQDNSVLCNNDDICLDIVFEEEEKTEEEEIEEDLAIKNCLNRIIAQIIANNVIKAHTNRFFTAFSSGKINELSSPS